MLKHKRSRRQAREVALKSLYQTEVGGAPAKLALKEQIAESTLTQELNDFAEELVRGVVEHCEEIDSLLTFCMVGWEIDRLAAVDRTLLRIACFELLYLHYVPPLVSLNEAIELAKRFSTAESGKFVHGVLSKVLPETSKANWTPPPDYDEDIEELAETADEEPVEVEEIEFESPELKELEKVGMWKLKAEQ